jgi:hypothetical protein
MQNNILLACSKCGKQRNIEITEARSYNKEHPYVCFNCSSVKEPPQPEQDHSKVIIHVPKLEHVFEYKKLDDMWWNVCKHCGIVDRSKDSIECDPNNKLTHSSGMNRHWHVMERIYNRNWNHGRLLPRSEWDSNVRFFTCTNCGHSCINNGWANRDGVCQQCRHQNNLTTISPTVYHDPDVNAELARTQNNNQPVIQQANSGTVPRTYTPEDYSPQTEFAKKKVEEFRARREQLDRELQRERERIDDYRPSRWPMLLPMIIIPLILIPLFLSITSSITSPSTVDCTTLTDAKAKQSCNKQNASSSSVDCATLPGNAGVHETTKNATSWEKQKCLVQQQTMSLVMLLPIIIVSLISLLTIRFILI